MEFCYGTIITKATITHIVLIGNEQINSQSRPVPVYPVKKLATYITFH